MVVRKERELDRECLKEAKKLLIEQGVEFIEKKYTVFRLTLLKKELMTKYHDSKE